MSQQAIKGVARLRVVAGKAAPSPAIGQALGPLGVNMMEFCKQFNDKTKDFSDDVPLPVCLTAYANRTFDFKVKYPNASWLLKRAAGVESGASNAGTQVVGTVKSRHVFEIAQLKSKCWNQAHIPVASIARQIAGTALSMGIKVVD